MQPVTIYSTPICPYCVAAKRLLDAKGVSYKNIDVMAEPHLREEMMKKSGGRHTVPQIFVGDTHVGGNDDLHALEYDGKLDALLSPQK